MIIELLTFTAQDKLIRIESQFGTTVWRFSIVFSSPRATSQANVLTLEGNLAFQIKLAAKRGSLFCDGLTN